MMNDKIDKKKSAFVKSRIFRVNTDSLEIEENNPDKQHEKS